MSLLNKEGACLSRLIATTPDFFAALATETEKKSKKKHAIKSVIIARSDKKNKQNPTRNTKGQINKFQSTHDGETKLVALFQLSMLWDQALLLTQIK